jgi:hypothetical protein
LDVKLQIFLEFGARDGNHFALEQSAEMRGQLRPDFFRAYDAIQDAFERRRSFIGNAARDDQIKVSQISRNIVREAVRSDPAAKVHAKGGEFLFFACGVADPDAVAARDARGGDSKIGCRADHGFFELLDVPADVATVFGEIEDGVTDDLAGAVVGDVAAAVGFLERDVHLGQEAVARAEIFFFAVAAQGDYVGVLAEDQDVWDRAGFAAFDELMLQCAGLGVGQDAHIHLPADFFLLVHKTVAVSGGLPPITIA